MSKKFKLCRRRKLSVTVVRKPSRYDPPVPVNGANVAYDGRVWDDSTDANGELTIQLFPGSYAITASVNSGPATERPVEIPFGKGRIDITIVIR